MKPIYAVCPRCQCLSETNEPEVKNIDQLELIRESHPEIWDACENLAPRVHNHGIDPSCKEKVVNGRLTGECLELGNEEGG